MANGTFDVMQRIGSLRLSKGDRSIAESAARSAESAAELLCSAGALIGSALASLVHARAGSGLT